MSMFRTYEPTPTLEDWFNVFAVRYRYVRRLRHRYFGRKSPQKPRQRPEATAAAQSRHSWDGRATAAGAAILGFGQVVATLEKRKRAIGDAELKAMMAAQVQHIAMMQSQNDLSNSYRQAMLQAQSNSLANNAYQNHASNLNGLHSAGGSLLNSLTGMR